MPCTTTPHHQTYIKPELGCIMMDGRAVCRHKGHAFSPWGFFTATPTTMGFCRQSDVGSRGKGVGMRVLWLVSGPQHLKTQGPSTSSSPSHATFSTPPPYICVWSNTDSGNCRAHTRCISIKGSVLGTEAIQSHWLCNQAGRGLLYMHRLCLTYSRAGLPS